DPEPGQRQDEGRQEHGPDHQREPSPACPDPPPGAQVQHDRHGHRRDEQEERERGLEADAHQVVLPAFRRRRPVTERRMRMRPSRWYKAHSTHRNTSTNRTIGTHSSSRVVGRSVAAPPVPPGVGEPTAVVPSASIAAAEPGAMVDSSTSNRSTAKRTGANGSCGGSGLAEAPLAAPAEAPGVAEGPGAELGPALLPALAGGAAEASGSMIGVAV